MIYAAAIAALLLVSCVMSACRVSGKDDERMGMK
jgi:predicted small secreted protein